MATILCIFLSSLLISSFPPNWCHPKSIVRYYRFSKKSMHLKLLHLKCSWNWNENLPWLAVWLGTSSSSWNISGALFFIFLAFKVWFQCSCWYLLFMFTIHSNGFNGTSTEYQTFPLQAYSIRDKNNFIFSLFLPN